MSQRRDDDAAPTESLSGFTATGPSDALAETMQADSSTGSGDTTSSSTTVERGTRIGRYVVDELIGAGGMGVVYRARDPALDRLLAIKLVRTTRGGSAGRARLLREAQAMAKLRHPNVVPIFDVGLTGDGVFVAMPCLEGGTLGDWVRAAPRPWRVVIARFVAAGRGLVAAHTAGLVHRDFKPDNVLLDADGEVAVADFGLARIGAEELPSSGTRRAEIAEDLTHTGDVLGTPAYMAPEQMRGEPSDARADQFSFCVALWEALYGRRPFDAGAERGAGALRVLLDQVTAAKLTAPTAGKDVPGWVRAALERGLRADPGARWSSMQALLGALGGPRRRRGVILGVAGAAIVAGGVAIALAATSSSAPASVDAAPAGPVRLRLDKLSTRGDVTEAALSPDGTRLAVIAGDRLVLRATSEDAEETLLAEDVTANVIDWSPDGSRLLLTRLQPVGATFVVLDVATREEHVLPLRAMIGSFTGDDEIAMAYANRDKIWWVSLKDPARASATCEVPGDFTWMSAIDGVASGEVVVTVAEDEAMWLLVVGRDCKVRATIRPDAMTARYVHHASGEIFTLSKRGQAFEIQAWNTAGEARGRPRAGRGDVLGLIGRQGERDLVLTLMAQTSLVRRHGNDTPITLLGTNQARFAVSPDGQRVAWVEHNDGWTDPGILRVDALDRIDRRAGKLLDDVYSAAWSLDGQRLAVVLDADGAGSLALVDPSSGGRTPLALVDVDRFAPPVWLAPERVAVQRLDHTTYDWIDVVTGERGTLVDPKLGWPFYLVRSPRDGTLAFGWNQGEGLALWVQDAGGLRQVSKDLLREAPVFTPDGALLLFSGETGVISSVDPRTGARRELARHELDATEGLAGLEVLPGGDYLLTVQRVLSDVSAAVPE